MIHSLSYLKKGKVILYFKIPMWKEYKLNVHWKLTSADLLCHIQCFILRGELESFHQ